MEAVVSLPVGNGLIAAACDALGVARATVYRHCARRAGPRAPSPSRPRPPRALTPEERQTVLDRLREPRFADLAPAEVYATLLDEASTSARSGPCTASWTTMTRFGSAATSCATRSTPSPNCSPKVPIRSGRGTSQS